MAKRTPQEPADAATQQAVAALYAKYKRYVLNIVHLRGVHEDDCIDVVHEVFLDVQRALPRLDPAARIKPKPWLKTIAKRKARDFSLRACSRHERLGSSPDSFDPTDTRPDPDQALVITEGRRALVEILEHLDEDRREVFTMHVLEEEPLSDVAHEQGIPEGTAASRLHRARLDFAAAVERRRAAEGSRVAAFLLSPAALIQAGRDAPDMTPEVEQHAWASLLQALGHGGLSGSGIGAALGASAGVAATPAGASAAAGMVSASVGLAGIGVAHLAGVAVVAAIAGGGAVYLATRQDTAPQAAEAAIVRAEPPEPARVTAALSASGSIEPRGPGASPEPSAAGAGTGEEGALGTASPGPRAAQYVVQTEELLLNRARRMVSTGHPDEALRVLDQHARLFPHGWLAGTRDELRRQARAQIEATKRGDRR